MGKTLFSIVPRAEDNENELHQGYFGPTLSDPILETKLRFHVMFEYFEEKQRKKKSFGFYLFKVSVFCSKKIKKNKKNIKNTFNSRFFFKKKH